MNRCPSFLVTTLLLALAVATLGPGRVHAQQDPCGVKREIGGQALDELTWKQLNGIYEDLSEERLDEAYEDLQRMLRRSERDNYLNAIINQALAQVEWSRKNYTAALVYFETAVALDALPDPAHFALMYQIAQLYFTQERHDEALERLDLWFCKSPEENITAVAWVLRASILVQKEDYPGVLTAIDNAIAMDEDSQESWHQLKLAAHYELHQFRQAAEALEVMLARWPNRKMYWTQLSQVHLKLEQEDQALAVLALAYRKGLLDEQSDIVNLSSLYSQSGIPYQAAQVLEKGVRDGVVESSDYYWVVIADTWYAAEELENSLRAYEEAGRLSSDGLVDLRRSFILIDLERWQAALESLDLALQKGGLDERNSGEAYLLRGMARFNLGDFESAGADWDRALRNDKTRESARQWINHMREQRERNPS